MSRALAAADREPAVQMDKARQIQQHLLPNGVQVPGLKLKHLFEPAEDVGGDYFDILPLKDGTWLFCVADVTGHRVPAAMNAAMLKTILLQATEQSTCPAEILAQLNRRFCAVNLVGDFVSVVVVRVAPHRRRLQYASAGHESAWLLARNMTQRELPSTGVLLGIDRAASWQCRSLGASRGERLLMVTDGVTEAFNVQRQCFGRQRLLQLLADSRQLTLEDATRHIEAGLTGYRAGAAQCDDMTLLLAEFA